MNYTSLQDYEHFLDKDSLSRVCIGKVSIVWFTFLSPRTAPKTPEDSPWPPKDPLSSRALLCDDHSCKD